MFYLLLNKPLLLNTKSVNRMPNTSAMREMHFFWDGLRDFNLFTRGAIMPLATISIILVTTI
jgi:hypothetical protein|tara:strand:+ start:297 stop:482 length:186 start_codon:yes stop_codon:yes gene_type:complete